MNIIWFWKITRIRISLFGLNYSNIIWISNYSLTYVWWRGWRGLWWRGLWWRGLWWRGWLWIDVSSLYNRTIWDICPTALKIGEVGEVGKVGEHTSYLLFRQGTVEEKEIDKNVTERLFFLMRLHSGRWRDLIMWICVLEYHLLKRILNIECWTWNLIFVGRYTGTSLLDSPVLALREVLSCV